MRILKNISYMKKWEVGIYFVVYIIYLVYGFLGIYKERDRILRLSIFQFSTGWKFIGRDRDDTNDELENFTSFINAQWHWYCLHVLTSAIFQMIWPQRSSVIHALIGTTALCFNLKVQSLAIFGALIFSFYAVIRTKSKSLTWILTCTWIVVINIIKTNETWYENVGYSEYFTLLVSVSWTLLRCCSFILNRIDATSVGNSDKDSTFKAEHYFGYILYYPTLVYGPFIDFNRYARSLQTTNASQGLLLKRLKTLFWELARVAFWWLILNFILHFLYIHYMERDVEAIKLIRPSFKLHAVGYFMGQFFFIFYVITYGLGIAFARFDGVDAPHRPRCIGRIHFYSDMWKHFDEGLYEFLFKYIYTRLCDRHSRLSSKLFATAATFVFVFLWHGCYFNVLIWSVLNFGFLVLEKCFKTLMYSEQYENWGLKHFGKGGALRLRALLATQIFIPAAFSNIYFISGQDIGNYLIGKAYMSGILNYFMLTICSYCFFQCSECVSDR